MNGFKDLVKKVNETIKNDSSYQGMDKDIRKIVTSDFYNKRKSSLANPVLSWEVKNKGKLRKYLLITLLFIVVFTVPLMILDEYYFPSDILKSIIAIPLFIGFFLCILLLSKTGSLKDVSFIYLVWSDNQVRACFDVILHKGNRRKFEVNIFDVNNIFYGNLHEWGGCDLNSIKGSLMYEYTKNYGCFIVETIEGSLVFYELPDNEVLGHETRIYYENFFINFLIRPREEYVKKLQPFIQINNTSDDEYV